jgi:acyl-CoA reductase-like NAD-dependent aldehyde dehydrogenase
MTIIHYSPINEGIFFETSETQMDEIASILNGSREAFRDWSSTSRIHRAKVLRSIANGIQARRSEIAEIVRQETGKPLRIALGEVDATIEMAFLISSECYRESNFSLPSAIPNREIKVERVPFGVAALIVSFNTPFPNYAWKAFPALMAGNTVILKPSIYTCRSAKLFEEILHSSGVPCDVFNLVFGGKEVGSNLVNQEVDLISFTGSSNVGIEIQKNASPRLIKTILELGGSNPILLTTNIDLNNAIPVIYESAFSNSGQRCAAGSRLIIHKSMVETFSHSFGEFAASKTVGTDQEADVGTLVSAEAKIAFENYLEKCRQSGAEINRFGKLLGDSNCVSLPAVIFELEPKHELAKCEIFAPALRVFVYEYIEEAIELANESDYALTAAVWDNDLENGMRIAKRIQSGVVNINGPTHGAEPSMPFGGKKMSGNGTREAGIQSVYEYSDTRVTSVFRKM